jgi:hypothetical protein
MSRALNINATQADIMAVRAQRNIGISAIEGLHSGGTRVVMNNIDDARNGEILPLESDCGRGNADADALAAGLKRKLAPLRGQLSFSIKEHVDDVAWQTLGSLSCYVNAAPS